jgi:hypothetical protein
MEENKVTIDLDWYTSLVEVYARFCALERMVQQLEYVSTADVIAVLGLETKEGENGAV